MDAMHPTYAARSVGCWARAGEAIWRPANQSGRQRLNVHGALDLETGKTAMIEVETVDAASTISLLEAIEEKYPLSPRSTSFSTMRAITMLSSCGNGWRTQAAGSRCASSPPTARI